MRYHCQWSFVRAEIDNVSVNRIVRVQTWLESASSSLFSSVFTTHGYSE